MKPSQRFSALIDTGALITGYSNYEVAQQLLKRGSGRGLRAGRGPLPAAAEPIAAAVAALQ